MAPVRILPWLDDPNILGWKLRLVVLRLRNFFLALLLLWTLRR